MKPEGYINGPWYICGYSDAGYAGDINTQKIVTETNISSYQISHRMAFEKSKLSCNICYKS